MKFKINLFFIILFPFFLTSCKEKLEYNTVFSKIMTNDKEYLDINYEKAQNKIEFLYEGETIIGNIFGNKISFDNKSFSKNNYIEISKNDIKIYLSIKDEDYLVYGTTNNSKVKFEEKENKINKILLEKRINLDPKTLSNFLFKFSKSNSLGNIESGSIKNKKSFIKDGDIVVVFDHYKDNMSKIRSTIYPNKLYEGYFTTILEQKKPFLVCLSINDGMASGNKFNDVGFSKSQIGEMYHYGNYSDKVKIKDYHFFYFDQNSSNVECSDYGYRTVLESTTSGTWIVSREGYYSFISNDWLNEIIFSNYINKNIIPNINSKLKKVGILKNGLTDYDDKNNSRALNNFNTNVSLNEIEQKYDAKTEKKLKEGKAIKIDGAVISW
jgi:hypothetical protein